MKKRPVNSRRGCLSLLISAGIIVSLCVLSVVTIFFSPALAAQSSDILRNVIGDDAVSHLESTVFQIQDTLEQWRYAVSWTTPSAPWPTVNPGGARPLVASTRNIPTSTPVAVSTEIVTVSPASVIPDPASTLTWLPPPATALGALDGEGIWSAYIQDSTGQIVSYRTYLQPTPTHPYAVVGAVAFDTSRTRLHYVLGFSEPYSPDSPRGTGRIPNEDKVPDLLIAMVNGGFKARHGQFGAMANGLIALPPRVDLGTISILNNGGLQLGEWGSDINPSPDMFAWRQNGPLVIHDGQINPRIYDDAALDWGYTVDDVSPTWRSGIGLSADGTTFYYLCGSSLSMEMLAKSMLAVGIANGIQLDINNYWVHFVAVRNQNNSLRLEPLFPDMMFEHIDRYLYASARDFFYITLLK